MFKFNQLESIHLEITSRCQASCPMCSRNFRSGLENPNLKLNDWTLNDFKNIFTTELLTQIKSFYFCGNFGDPIINDNLIDMCHYAVMINPNIEIRIHTNGGARKTSWWKELAQVLPVKHNVHIAIDGLEDTHHLYRVGTTYDNVLKNAKAFIEAGGKATWTFLKFKHNEHQVEEAERRAKEAGFESFSMKSTSRFIGEPRFKVFDKDGNISYYLEAPSDSKLSYIDTKTLENFESFVKDSTIKCYVLETRQIYIDAFMKVYPCCWLALASTPTVRHNEDKIVTRIRNRIETQYKDIICKLDNNASTRSVKDIINDEQWQLIWKQHWEGENKLVMCARTCGKAKITQIAQPQDQFLENKKYE